MVGPLDGRALRIVAAVAAGAKAGAEAMERLALDDDPEPSVPALRGIVGDLASQVIVLADLVSEVLEDRAAALRAAAAAVKRVERERDARRHVGGVLSNVAYNLAQITALDDNTRRTLDDLRRRWDAIPTARAVPDGQP